MNKPESSDISNRCRLVLIAPQAEDDAGLADAVGAALTGGDVASVILPSYGLDEAAFQRRAERIAEVMAAHQAALMIAGEPRIAVRVRADGMHVEQGPAALRAALEKYAGTMMVGAGGAKTRHAALELGECRPDYVFFGRFGYDLKPEPHPRNLALAEWWAALIEIPCIVMGGSDLASLRAAAGTGAEFAALSRAIFEGGAGPAENVAAANALLDEAAPRFEEAET